jgi:hypothetical protein
VKQQTIRYDNSVFPGKAFSQCGLLSDHIAIYQ